MNNMLRRLVLVVLLSFVATAKADTYDKHEILSELQSELNSKRTGRHHGRELWWWITSKDRETGEVCGRRNTCAAGLQCTDMALGARCAPRTSCLEEELQQFELDFDVAKYKQDVFDEAGVTQQQLVEAAEASGGTDAIVKNPSVRALITAMRRNIGQFNRVQDIVSRCSGFDNQGQGSPSAPTEPPTEAPSSPPSSLASDSENLNPSKQPTKAPSAMPSASPTLNRKKSFYEGFSIEGGALMEGSFTLFWEADSKMDFPPVYVKGCIGLGPAIGADVSFITIIADTAEPTEIQCLSTMYDVDIHVGLGAGYGLGVCMLSQPTFVYNEIKWGAGFGIGASMFSVCDGAQVAKGYDDGIDSPESHDGHGQGGGKGSDSHDY